MNFKKSQTHPIQNRKLLNVMFFLKLEILHRHHLSQNAQEILEIFYAKDVPTYLWTVYEKENKLKK
jgi:hypothetical protein